MHDASAPIQAKPSGPTLCIYRASPQCPCMFPNCGVISATFRLLVSGAPSRVSSDPDTPTRPWLNVAHVLVGGLGGAAAPPCRLGSGPQTTSLGRLNPRAGTDPERTGGGPGFAWRTAMRRRSPFLATLLRFMLSVALPLVLAVAACRRPVDPTELVVGVQSDPMGGVVSALRVVVRVAGAPVVDHLVKTPHRSTVGLPPPWEKVLPGTRTGRA